MFQRSNIFDKSATSRGSRPGYKLDEEYKLEDLLGNGKNFTLSSKGEVIGNIQCNNEISNYAKEVITYLGKEDAVLGPLKGKAIRVISGYNFISSYSKNYMEEAFITEVKNRIKQSGISHLLVEVKESRRTSINDSIKLHERCKAKLVFDEYSSGDGEERIVLMQYDL